MYPIITISREFGSGGHYIGQAVAKELGIPFYDSVIVEEAAKKSGYSTDTVVEDGEYTTLSQTWFSSNAAYNVNYLSPQDKIFEAQRNVILDLAEKGPCVIVGRCADYILDTANIPALNVFIHANMEYRKAHVLERYGKTNVPIEKRLRKKDKGRKTYYRYYTDREWGQSNYYHISLDASYLGELTCVDIITSAARRKNENK